MKNVIYIENKRFYIESDSSQIRDEERYCAIKDRINRRAALPQSNFDWQSVYADAQLLAESVGIDLIIASYFTVAAFKTQGLRGLANGLALINAALLNQNTHDLKQQKLNKGLVDWIKKEILSDIGTMQPSYDAMRDLYRCERECQILDDVLGSQLEMNEGIFEEIALYLLQYIERLEMRYHRSEKVQERVVEELSKFSWNDTALVIAASLMSAVFTFVVMTYLPK
jgi:type VI secretion system protein VasL